MPSIGPFQFTIQIHCIVQTNALQLVKLMPEYRHHALNSGPDPVPRAPNPYIRSCKKVFWEQFMIWHVAMLVAFSRSGEPGSQTAVERLVRYPDLCRSFREVGTVVFPPPS